jgi:hypothetical protein
MARQDVALEATMTTRTVSAVVLVVLAFSGRAVRATETEGRSSTAIIRDCQLRELHHPTNPDFPTPYFCQPSDDPNPFPTDAHPRSRSAGDGAQGHTQPSLMALAMEAQRRGITIMAPQDVSHRK